MEPVIDQAKLTAQFAGMVQALKSQSRSFLGEVGQIISTSIQTNFEVGGRYSMKGGVAVGGTQRWDISRRAEREGGMTLVDTSLLRQSVQARILGNGQLRVGTNLAYAAIHQFGGTVTIADRTKKKRKRKGAKNGQAEEAPKEKRTFEMPARPYIVIQAEDIIDIQEAAIAHAKRVLGGG